MHRVAERMRAPVESFLHMETAGGIVLLLAAAGALIWANSPGGESYHHFWETTIHLGIGGWHAAPSLHFLINDGLMTIFFLLAGLEIKREIAEGELSDLRRASLPIAAAIGGMLVPAIFYIALNPSGPASRGWGVPMATDIAFALGILSLLGKKVPAAMRILLLALAIIDDLGAILVIAVFYTTSLDFTGVLVGVAGLGILVLWLRLGVRPGPLYLVPLAVIWAGLLIAGVHPTLAGVLVGVSMPVRPWLDGDRFMNLAARSMDEFQRKTREQARPHELLAPVRRLAFAGREAVSPVVRLESALHPYVAFAIMPLFALANAGVSLGGVGGAGEEGTMVLLGVALGLAVGKPVGVLLISWIGVRLGICTLPKGVTWGGMLIIGLAAGIGFTMAIFIGELAFKGQPELLEVAKMAILGATALAAVTALILGAVLLPRAAPEIARLTPAEVEASNEY